MKYGGTGKGFLRLTHDVRVGRVKEGSSRCKIEVSANVTPEV
jgi:hypothetical protein